MKYPFELMTERLDREGISYDETVIARLEKYADMLALWNEKINLTAITDVDKIILNHYADCAIVEGVVCVHVKEWILENTCREADLVGSRVVVGVNGLWGHIPFCFIHRFAKERK